MARVKGDTWEGESDALLAELNDIVGEAIQQNRQWPKAPHVLSRRMNRAMGVLRKIGIEIKGWICQEDQPPDLDHYAGAQIPLRPKG